MVFDPNAHLRNLKGQMYLDVKWRLLWLREEHLDAIITTSLEQYRDDTQMWVFKAQVVIPGGGSATGHGQETERDFPAGACEKAETKAIGRALAALGYGTQFALDRDASESEGDRPVDSPVQPAKPARAAQKGLKVVDDRKAATKTAPAENERQQALRLNAHLTELCTALDIAPPQSQQDLATLGQSFGWHAPKDAAPSATWKEQLIVRLEGEQARRADERAHPTTTSPAAEGELWTEPGILADLKAANAQDMEGIALAIINAHAAGTLTDDTASALAACVDLAERAFKATSAGQIAQVEIDAKASTTLNVDQYDAVVALTRRVRVMHGWQGSTGTNSRQPATAGAR